MGGHTACAHALCPPLVATRLRVVIGDVGVAVSKITPGMAQRRPLSGSLVVVVLDKALAAMTDIVRDGGIVKACADDVVVLRSVRTVSCLAGFRGLMEVATRLALNPRNGVIVIMGSPDESLQRLRNRVAPSAVSGLL